MAIPLVLSEVPNLTPYAQYVASSGQTVFPYPFPITQDSDLVVVVNGVTQATDGGYTLSGQGNDTGGNLTFTLGRTAGDIVTLFRDVAIERITQIGQNSGFSSTAFNAEFNNLYLIMQQLESQIAQCLQIPNTNNPAPVTTLAKASYAGLYLSFDANGNPQPAALTPSGSVTSSLINSLINLTIVQTIASLWNPQTPAEQTAGVTPVNYFKTAGNLLRYGNNTTPGTTDMSTALTNALASNASIYAPAGTYYFAQAGSFSLSSGQTLYGDGKANTLFKFLYAAGDNLSGSGVVNATVRDMSIQVTGTGVNTYIGAVAFRAGSSYCRAANLYVTGVSGCGVYIGSSSNCRIQFNDFASFQGTNSDQADIYVGQLTNTGTGSNYNLVEGNNCFGGGWHGIIIQTQNASTPPNLYNTVCNNRVGQHVAYGIASYSGAATVDNFNQIIGNYIENIQGTALSGQAGAGIYSVSAGGNIIANNTIRNCCVQTTSQSLAPGGIGVAQVSGAGVSPVVVSGNNISGMTKYFGIYVTLCSAGVALTGNTILHPVSNTTGSAIGLQSCSNVSVSSGLINSASTQAAIISNALANISNIVINGVQIQHAGVGVLFTTPGSFTQSLVAVTGNQLTGSGGSACINSGFLAGATFANNTCATGNASCTSWTSCTQTRLSNNFFSCSGAYALVTSGTCTASNCDESNYLAGTSNTGLNAISNSGAGFRVAQLGTAAAGAAGSTQQLGDTVILTTGVTNYAWVITTAGTPGSSTAVPI